MNKIVISSALLTMGALMASCGQKAAQTEEQTIGLAEAYADCWYTGVSVNQWEVSASDDVLQHNYSGNVSNDQTEHWNMITRNFNWTVAENCMKCEVIHPEEDRYDFTLGDQFVNKAKAAGMKVLGHNLIWHSQCAPWFFVDGNGKLVSAEVLKARMKEHITSIVTHFKGRVDAWDVVNEAFEDDGSFRNSLFYQILGEEFLPLAFQYAHEADPDAELYYNDYSMNKATKVEAVCNFFRPLIEKGLPITAIGMQGHIILEDGGDEIVAQYAHSIETIAALGLRTGFSELDLSVLPNPFGFSGANVSDIFAYRPEMDPYREGLSETQSAAFDKFWIDFYTMLLNHKESIDRVTFWCTNDGNSWRNDFPIRGRMDYATLFGRDGKPKPVVQKLIDLRKQN